MSEEASNYKRPAVFARRTKSGRGIIVNLPKTYIYFDRYDLINLLKGNTTFIKGTVYRKKEEKSKWFENGEEYMNRNNNEINEEE